MDDTLLAWMRSAPYLQQPPATLKEACSLATLVRLLRTLLPPEKEPLPQVYFGLSVLHSIMRLVIQLGLIGEKRTDFIYTVTQLGEAAGMTLRPLFESDPQDEEQSATERLRAQNAELLRELDLFQLKVAEQEGVVRDCREREVELLEMLDSKVEEVMREKDFVKDEKLRLEEQSQHATRSNRKLTERISKMELALTQKEQKACQEKEEMRLQLQAKLQKARTSQAEAYSRLAALELELQQEKEKVQMLQAELAENEKERESSRLARQASECKLVQSELRHRRIREQVRRYVSKNKNQAIASRVLSQIIELIGEEQCQDAEESLEQRSLFHNLSLETSRSFEAEEDGAKKERVLLEQARRALERAARLRQSRAKLLQRFISNFSKLLQ